MGDNEILEEKNGEKVEEAIFPVCVIEINRSDIECAVDSFEEELQKAIRGITWDKNILAQIRKKLRNPLVSIYSDLLEGAIKDALKDEIEEMKTKRSFLRGLKAYIERGKRK